MCQEEDPGVLVRSSAVEVEEGEQAYQEILNGVCVNDCRFGVGARAGPEVEGCREGGFSINSERALKLSAPVPIGEQERLILLQTAGRLQPKRD